MNWQNVCTHLRIYFLQTLRSLNVLGPWRCKNSELCLQFQSPQELSSDQTGRFSLGLQLSFKSDNVDGSEIRRSPVDMVNFPSFCWVLTFNHPRWCRISSNSSSFVCFFSLCSWISQMFVTLQNTTYQFSSSFRTKAGSRQGCFNKTSHVFFRVFWGLASDFNSSPNENRPWSREKTS